MHRALLKLFRLRMYGGLRRRLRHLKTVRGVVFFMVGVAVLAFCVNAGSLGSTSAEVSRVFSNEDTFKRPAREVMPFLLLAACLVTVATTSGPAIYFSPAEVNFLFAGPFGRRSLLLYKFLFFATGAAISGLIVAVLLPHYAGGRAAAFTGAFLSLVFIQLFSVSIGLVAQIIAERAYTRLRRYVLLAVVAAVALGCWPVVASGMDQGFVAILSGFRQTLIGTVLLAPFEVFVMTFSAERICPDLLLWGSAAVAIDAAMLGAMIWADANYYEAATATSQKMYRRWQRVRRGGMVWSSEATAAWHLPAPPPLGGVGPIAWRQLTTAVRTSGKVLVVLLIVATVGGPLLILSGGHGTSPWTAVGILVWATVFFLPRVFNFDFRNDVEHLAELKALPLAPMVVGAGQLVVPVLLLTLLHLVALCGAAVCATGVTAGLALGDRSVHPAVERAAIWLGEPDLSALSNSPGAAWQGRFRILRANVGGVRYQVLTDSRGMLSGGDIGGRGISGRRSILGPVRPGCLAGALIGRNRHSPVRGMGISTIRRQPPLATLRELSTLSSASIGRTLCCGVRPLYGDDL